MSVGNNALKEPKPMFKNVVTPEVAAAVVLKVFAIGPEALDSWGQQIDAFEPKSELEQKMQDLAALAVTLVAAEVKRIITTIEDRIEQEVNQEIDPTSRPTCPN
jgi:hypothetical protein